VGLNLEEVSRAGGEFHIRGKRVAVVGSRGMVGSAVVRRLAREECDVIKLGREDVDLRRQEAVERWFADHQIDLVFLAAAKVGGIAANSCFPAEFLYDNLMIEANVVEAARQTGVRKLLFLGSSCIYPKYAAQPIAEDALLTGALEPTNEAYALAKIAGIKLCQAYRTQYGCDFISAQPTNLYGPGDNFDLQNSHVVPALMRKAHDAKAAGEACLAVWGSGTPRRELLHVDDLADALVFLAIHYSGPVPINVGSGEEHTIAELAAMIAGVVGYTGRLAFDPSYPDGTPRKLLDTSTLDNLGWKAQIPLENGLRDTYAWYLTINSMADATTFRNASLAVEARRS
jgi:GDP-L-fucose synthase